MKASRIPALVLAILLLCACGGGKKHKPVFYDNAEEQDSLELDSGADDYAVGDIVEVPFVERAGVKLVEVTINGQFSTQMIIDSGCSSTLITIAEAKYLYQKGCFSTDDIIGTTTAQIADGSIVENMVVRLNKIAIGGKIECKTTAGGSTQHFPADADKDQIAKACHSGGYVFIDKAKGYDTLATNGFRGQLRKKKVEIERLRSEGDKQRKEIDGLKNKQRNTTVVAVLAAIVIVLGMVVWNKVLFPSEVTKKDMGEYIYYGPMADGKPNGTGVAIYKNDDSDGRLYYYGNFTNGERQDEAAVLFYRNGTYFRGKMKGDKWQEGLLLNVDKEMFLGTFENNQPYVGDWYKYEHAQHVDKWE